MKTKINILYSKTRCNPLDNYYKEKEINSKQTISPDQDGLYIGRVKWYDHEKGFGFINKIENLPEGAKKEAFVRYTDLKDSVKIKENDKVRFQFQDSIRGPRALNVSLLS